MPREDPRLFIHRLLQTLGEAAAIYVYPKIPSRTLQNSLEVVVDDDAKAAYVQIPQYWAVYVHDGRAAFGAERTTFLVWFRNPKDDPRLVNGVTPERAADLKFLTREQFQFWIRRNREAIAAGQPPPMIVRRYVGEVAGKFFFDNEVGMKGFDEIADEIARKEFGEFLDAEFADLPSETVGTVIPLRFGIS